MNALMLTSFVIPGGVALLLITLLIRERYNLIPKRQDRRARGFRRENNIDNDLENKERSRKKEHEDFLDLSGGIMGI